jgi:hypothetical protein
MPGKAPGTCGRPRPGLPVTSMNRIPLLLAALLLPTQTLLARGGAGFHGGDMGGGFREEEPGIDADSDSALREDQLEANRFAADEERPDDDGASVRVQPEGNDTANVNARTAGGKDYDATVAGPDGYRAGYIWQNGEYVAVDCEPWAAYLAPFGAWAGWSVVTQPDYLDYPAYASFPVETAVEIALQKLGLYDGPIDGNAASCASAIEEYQTQNSMAVTGTITPELLTALGIQASFGQ